MATITNLKFAIDSSWNGNGVKAARGDLKLLQQDLRRIQNTKIRVDVDLDDTSVRAKLRRLDNDTRNRALEIRVDADTAKAEAQIDIAARNRTARIDVDSNGLVGQLNEIDDNFKKVSNSSVELGSSASMAMRLAKVAAAAFIASLVVMPGIIQTIGGAMTIGLGGAFIAVGALFHKENQAIIDGAKSLGDTFMAAGKRASEGMVQPIINGLADLKQHVAGLEDEFKLAFDGASQAVEPLIDGIAWMVENSMPGVIKAMQNITPVANGLRDGMGNFGREMSRMFAGMSEGASGLGRALDVTFTQIGVLMANFGVAAGQMADNGAKLWDGFLVGFNNFVSGYLDGMVRMVNANAPSFAQFWKDFGQGVGDFLREALPGIGNLGAAFSDILGPAIRDLGGPLGTLVSKLADSLVPILEKMAPHIERVVDGCVEFLDFIGRFSGVLGPAIAAMWLFRAAFVAHPIGALITGLVMLTFYLIDLEKRTQVFSNAWRSFGDSLGGVGDKFAGVGEKLKAVFGPQLSDMWNNMKQGFHDAIEPIKESLSGLGDALKPLWQELQPVLKIIGAAIGASASAFLGMYSGAIKPVMGFIGDAFSEVVQIIKGLVQVITGVIRTIKGVFEVVMGFVRVIMAFFSGNDEAFRNAWKSLGKGLEDIIHGLGKTLQGLWSIVTAIWDTIFAVFKRGGQLVWGVVSGFVKGVISFFTNLWDVLVGHSIVPDMIKAIFDWFMWLPRKIIQLVETFVGRVIGFFQWLWDQVVQKFNAFKDVFVAAFNAYADFIRGAWDKIWSWVRDFVVGVWDWIKQRWDDFWTGIKVIWEAWTTFIRVAWDQLWSWIRDFAVGVWDWIKTKWDDFWNGIKIIWEAFSTFIRGAWDKLWSWVRDFASGVWDWIKDKWSTFWDNIGARWTQFRDWLSGLWNEFWTWVKDFVSGVWDRIVEKFDAIKTKIGEIIQGMVDKVRDIWNTVTDIFNKPVEGIKNIWNKVSGVLGLPGFAEGGQVNAYATGGAVFGAGTSTSDSIPALLSNNEHVWTAREVDAAGGHGAVESMRAEVMSGKRGRMPEYANGGAVEWMWARVKEMQPAMQLTSSYRDTNDFHGQGKAVDVSNGTDSTPQMRDLAQQINAGYGRNTLELIHNPSPYNIKNGGNVGDGYGFYGAGTMGQHRNHVHWAVDGPLDGRSGAAAPGGAGSGSGSSGPSAAQIQAHKEAIGGIQQIIADTYKTSATLVGEANRYASNQVQSMTPFIGGGVSDIIKSQLTDDYMSAKNAGGTFAPAGDVHAAGTGKVGDGAIGKLNAAMSALSAAGAASMGGYGQGYQFYVDEIKAAAKERNLERRAAKIGVATALVETNLKMYANNGVPDSLNYPHDAVGSDHDSIGLFQQRQAGWGTTAQRMNPRASAGMFFNALQRLGDWRSMEDGAAAQAVQVSAYPGKYSQRMGEADGLVGGYMAGTDNAASGWHMVGEAGPEMVQFRGGETVKTFDQIIASLKTAATAEGRTVSLKVSADLQALADKIGQMNLGNNTVNINIEIDGAQEVGAIVSEVRSQVIPQLEQLLRQGIGKR